MTSAHMAELDGAGIVLRVIVAPEPAWPTTALGGTWVQVPAGSCGPGWRWDGAALWPWGVDNETGSLWCVRTAWESVDLESREAFMEVTGLTILWRDPWVIFGGRAITDEDQVALAEVLG